MTPQQRLSDKMKLAIESQQPCAKVMEKVHRIDALIGNAAIAQVANQELTVNGLENQLGVNHFGHYLLCGLLFERIEASAGRIVVREEPKT